MTQPSIPRFLWFYVPILFILAQIGIEIFVLQEKMAALHSESGPHEMLQSIFITAAFLVGIFTLPKINWRLQKPLGFWLLIATVCSFYVAGEEISWGQHILKWNTPEYWTSFNDQAETNLHNTSAWLDQKPRLLLFIGVVLGGLVVPALRRWKPLALPARFADFYPPDILAVTTLGVLIPYTIQALAEIWDIRVFERVSEVQELYMYYFVLLYLINFRKIIKAS